MSSVLLSLAAGGAGGLLTAGAPRATVRVIRTALALRRRPAGGAPGVPPLDMSQYRVPTQE